MLNAYANASTLMFASTRGVVIQIRLYGSLADVAPAILLAGFGNLNSLTAALISVSSVFAVDSSATAGTVTAGKICCSYPASIIPFIALYSSQFAPVTADSIFAAIMSLMPFSDKNAERKLSCVIVTGYCICKLTL